MHKINRRIWPAKYDGGAAAGIHLLNIVNEKKKNVSRQTDVKTIENRLVSSAATTTDRVNYRKIKNNCLYDRKRAAVYETAAVFVMRFCTVYHVNEHR